MVKLYILGLMGLGAISCMMLVNILVYKMGKVMTEGISRNPEASSDIRNNGIIYFGALEVANLVSVAFVFLILFQIFGISK